MPSRFWHRCGTLVALCIAGAASAGDAFAQSSSMFGSGGALSGNTGFGAGSSPAMGTAFGSVPGSTMPSSSMPGGMMPANTMPSSSLPGMSGTMGQTGIGASGQRAGLIGQASTRLAGVSAAGPQTGTGFNQQGQNRNTGRGTQRANQNQNQDQGGNQQVRTIRPQLVVAFSPPIPAAETMHTRLTTRIKKMQKPGFQGVSVEVDGRHVILRGEVASEEARRMAKLLVKLEPGVKSVQNELVVVTPQPAPVE